MSDKKGLFARLRGKSTVGGATSGATPPEIDPQTLKALAKLEAQTQAEAKKAQDGAKKARADQEEARWAATQAKHDQAQKDLAAAERQLKSQTPALSKALATDADAPDGEINPTALPGGVWGFLHRGLTKTRDSLTQGLAQVLVGKKEITGAVLEELEELLLTADLGPVTTRRLLNAVEQKMRRQELKDPQRLKAVLRAEIGAIMTRPAKPVHLPGLDDPGTGTGTGTGPAVILFVGVNGVGKTTTVGKLAHRFQTQGKKALLAAGDTFRAAAADQLDVWRQRAGVDILSADPGADPASVIHRAAVKARDEGYDLLLCDTAGRLHTKHNLMEELAKINRVIGKAIPGAPHETWLVIDANTGQNAIHQTRTFSQSAPLTGLVVTKLDGTAKGGVVVGIVNEFNLPIRYIGMGEALGDLQPFDPQAFADNVLE